jgi:hypothetical protein
MSAYEAILIFGIGAYSLLALAVFSALGAKRWKKPWLFKFHRRIGVAAVIAANNTCGISDLSLCFLMFCYAEGG